MVSMANQTVAVSRSTDNPWITTTEFPIGISAAEIVNRRADLLAWSAETGQPLPLPADYIVRLELAGYVVNLETGRRSVAPKFAPLEGGAHG